MYIRLYAHWTEFSLYSSKPRARFESLTVSTTIFFSTVVIYFNCCTPLIPALGVIGNAGAQPENWLFFCIMLPTRAIAGGGEFFAMTQFDVSFWYAP